MKRVRKRSTGRRAPVAKSSKSKSGASRTGKSKTKPVKARAAKTSAVKTSSANGNSTKRNSAKANPAKTRLLKKRTHQVTANTRVNKVRAKESLRSGVRTPATGMVEAALAAFAHEVRTPLTGILAISDLLATSELGERERRWVDTIKAGAEHLSSLATLFVDAAKDGTTGIVPRQDLFDLRVLARGAGDSLAGRAAAKGLQYEVDISEELPALVVGDPVRLRAALENLIDNAVKFTEHGGVSLTVAPTARAKRGKRGARGKANTDPVAVTFAISDSGIGLSLQEIKRLFRPFSQANVSIASRFGGAGLGLSSVRQLARAMGGDVAVAPHAGGGTTFTLTMTLSEAEAPSAELVGSEDGVTLVPVRQLRVLGVEDNPFGRVVLNTILNELGHQAEFIGRGEAAPERITKGGLDAVLMDMVLPGINGVEAIGLIRKLTAPYGQIPIIGVSGRGEDEAPSRAAGADAFLLKPVSPRALATALIEATHRAAAAT
jgi:signal transduction histidine kinase/CheY-like chemotaxis protein